MYEDNIRHIESEEEYYFTDSDDNDGDLNSLEIVNNSSSFNVRNSSFSRDSRRNRREKRKRKDSRHSNNSRMRRYNNSDTEFNNNNNNNNRQPIDLTLNTPLVNLDAGSPTPRGNRKLSRLRKGGKICSDSDEDNDILNSPIAPKPVSSKRRLHITDNHNEFNEWEEDFNLLDEFAYIKK